MLDRCSLAAGTNHTHFLFEPSFLLREPAAILAVMADENDRHKESAKGIAKGKTKPQPQEPVDPELAFPVPPAVIFSPDALDWLRLMDKRAEPGMVLSVLWAYGRNYNSASDEYVENGSGLIVGWYHRRQVPSDRIVEYPGLHVVFVLPPTDAATIHIKIAKADRGDIRLIVDGPAPFVR